MKPHRCYYTLVRYIPDPSRGEFLNVGILLCCPEAKFLEFRARSSLREVVNRVFPNGDAEAVVSRVSDLHEIPDSPEGIVAWLKSLTGGDLHASAAYNSSVLMMFHVSHCNDIQFTDVAFAAGEPDEVLDVLHRTLVD